MLLSACPMNMHSKLLNKIIHKLNTHMKWFFLYIIDIDGINVLCGSACYYFFGDFSMLFYFFWPIQHVILHTNTWLVFGVKLCWGLLFLKFQSWMNYLCWEEWSLMLKMDYLMVTRLSSERIQKKCLLRINIQYKIST